MFLQNWESKCHTAECSSTCPLLLSWRFNLVLRILLYLADFLGLQQLWLKVQYNSSKCTGTPPDFAAVATVLQQINSAGGTCCCHHAPAQQIQCSGAASEVSCSQRRHRKHSASGHYQHSCLCAVQLLCSCLASLVHPRSIRCPYQRHVYADHLCSKLIAGVYAVTSWELRQSKHKKILQVFQSHPKHKF